MTKKPIVVAIAMAISASAVAEQTTTVTEFDQVLVTATRVTEKLLKLAAVWLL